jgi:hypothetical protein
LSGGIEENYTTPQGEKPIFRPVFEHVTSRNQTRNVNYSMA